MISHPSGYLNHVLYWAWHSVVLNSPSASLSHPSWSAPSQVFVYLLTGRVQNTEKSLIEIKHCLATTKPSACYQHSYKKSQTQLNTQNSINSANSYKHAVSDATCITFHYITDEAHFQNHKLIYQLTFSCYVNI